METVEVINRPHNRNMGQYTNDELVALAKLRYLDFIRDDYSSKDIDTRLLMKTLYSLERFNLAGYCSIKVNGRFDGWAWVVTDKGVNELNHRKPRNYGCKCEYAIVIPCVCSERTYCPNPLHEGNGCHGTHD